MFLDSNIIEFQNFAAAYLYDIKPYFVEFTFGKSNIFVPLKRAVSYSFENT